MLCRLFKGLKDIIYPKTCLACKNKLDKRGEDELICGHCWGKIIKNTPPFCNSCGRQLKKNNFAKSICPKCLKAKLQHSLPVFTME